MRKIEQSFVALCVGLLPIALGALPLPIVDVKTIASPDFEALSPYVLDLSGDWRCDGETNVLVSSEQGGSSYRRSFELPPHWMRRKTYLDLSGMFGDATPWVNGKALHPIANGVYEVEAVDFRAPNDLVVKVVCAPDAQRRSLCGGVRLFSAPKIELRDFRVAVIPATDSPVVEVEVEAEVFKSLGDVSISGIRGVADCVAKIFDEEGRELASSPIERRRLSTKGPTTLIRQKLTVDSLRLWSADTPVAYTVAVQVDRDLRARRVLFRDARQRDQAVLRAIRVSAADFPREAAASAEDAVACLSRLKQANFNTVLVNPGDLPDRFVELCDSFGLYVVTNAVSGVMSYGELGPQGTTSFEEAKFANSPLRVSCSNAAMARALLRNDHTAIAASDYVARWSLTQDGVELAGGTFDLPPIAAGKRDEMELPLPEADTVGLAGECYYNLSFSRREAAPGVPAGHEVVHYQFPFVLPMKDAEVPIVERGARLDVRANDETDCVEVKAGVTKVAFDLAGRRVHSLTMDGQEVITPCADLGLFVEGLGALRARPGDLRVEDGAVIVTDEVLTEGETVYGRTMRWQFFEDGKVRVELELKPAAPRPDATDVLGFAWRPDDLAGLRFSYLGRGPWANRPGACAAATIGLYSGAGAELSGMRTDVRSVTVLGSNDAGVEIRAEKPFALVFGPEVRMLLTGPGAPFGDGKWTFDLRAVRKQTKAKSSWWLF